MTKKVKSKFNLRLTTPEDMHLETYDHTKLSAINTCPTYGILRYQMHKKMSGEGRSMALEAGGAMHECFSFIRLVSLVNQYEGKPEFQDVLWDYHGTRLFGAERLAQIDEVLDQASDVVEVAKRGSIAVLDTGGFYDDARDKRRTLSNLEECIYAYINRWRWEQRVWIRDPDDATSDVGIEIPFDVVIHIEADNDELMFRLTGRIDGIHYNNAGDLLIADNKTASRLNDAWAMSFLLSHQITGYCVAASVFTQHLVHKAEILGLAIPLPKTYDLGGYIRETVNRHDYHYVQWAKWLEHTVRLVRDYADDPINAPKFTHSCNRYFRPCTFVPFCDNSEEEQRLILSEMVTDEWSPLSKPVLDGVGSE
jgi:hypothetical protein